jgi:DNA-binding transcriptional regulator YbjK
MRLRMRAVAHYALRRTKESDADLSELSHRTQTDPDAAFFVAMVYSVRGETDQAMWWLKRAYAQHETVMFDLIKNAPAFRNIEHDPRYQDLLRRLNLPD